MAGKLTHEQQIRTMERKPDIPKQHEVSETRTNAEIAASHPSGDPMREQGTERSMADRAKNQESRDHNKHNHQSQEGHGIPRPTPDQEKS